MSGKSKIEWLQGGKVWNPVTGCTKVSEGCRHCYAESIERIEKPFKDLLEHNEYLKGRLKEEQAASRHLGRGAVLVKYQEFLKSKVVIAPKTGFEIEDSEIHSALKPHQKAIVRWMVAGGRRACFAAFGLGKTIIQIEAVRLTRERAGGMGLIVVPLNDSVQETAGMEENSVGLILTSIPFSTQYEYSPNYADFGHSDNNAHFFEQMDYLTPNLFKVLQPGRIAAIHVKDRIVPGGMTGLGFQTVYPFHARCIEHYTKHGFAYMGMKTIVTDVVRENNQTYRLGWTEQCKDGSKMGVGMPEYLLLFRKPPTDTINSYADKPVVKSKERYSRARWQIDAHGFARSSGDRLLRPEELESLTHEQIYKAFKAFSLDQVYDYEHHVKIGEHLDSLKMLPVTFMLLPPQSWSDEVWTDITRMLTLNGAQSAKGKEMHLCPMQFDLADRIIEQFTMPGEVVFDPFGGLMTVPYRAVLKGRYGLGCELSPRYFLDGAYYCKAAEKEISTPTLFDLLKAAE